MKPASRYHPLLVALHWLLAALILAALAVGFFGLAAMPNADPQKIAGLRWHMAGGMLILALMVIRLVVHLATARPAPANRLAPVALYHRLVHMDGLLARMSFGRRGP
jgi:cytochrome b561